MKLHIKTIIAILLCVIAVLWLIPTIFVETTVCEIKSYELVKSAQGVDTYRITFTYERGGKILEGSYKAKYDSRFIPLVGEQDACHYLTFPPHPVFTGDAPSPVPPLVTLVIGVLVYVIDFKKFFKKKKEKVNVPQA